MEDGREAVEAWAMESGKRGQDSATIEEAKLEVLKQTARRLKLANDEKEGRLASKPEVIGAVQKALAVIGSTLDREAKVNLPPALVGLDAVTISGKICEVIDKAYAQVKTELERFGKDGE